MLLTFDSVNIGARLNGWLHGETVQQCPGLGATADLSLF